MAATVIDMANAVVTALNGATLSQTFTAVRAYVAVYNLKDLTALKVTVVPSLLAVTAFDMDSRRVFEWGIGVWIQKKADRDTASIDPLMTLAEEVIDLFRDWRVGAFRITGLEASPALSPDQLDAEGVFTFVVTLTVRVTR